MVWNHNAFLLTATTTLWWSQSGGHGGHGGVHAQQPPADAMNEDRVRTDWIRLLPFDVQIAMTAGSTVDDINLFALTDIVQDWMSDSFATKVVSQDLLVDTNNATTFASLLLELRTGDNGNTNTNGSTNGNGSTRRLQQRSLQLQVTPLTDDLVLFTAGFDGVSLWERTGVGTPPMDAEIVEFLQRSALFGDEELLALLQSAEAYTGLGPTVVRDVRALLTPRASTDSPDTYNNNNNSSNENLEIIIIIAIVVACLAFGLLLFAVLWAWHTDQNKRDAYKTGGGSRGGSRGVNGNGNGHGNGNGNGSTNAGGGGGRGRKNNTTLDIVPTESESEGYPSPTGMSPPAVANTDLYARAQQSNPPAEISDQEYPESVISEDISTSLTAYYRSGMGYANPSTTASATLSSSSLGMGGGGGGGSARPNNGMIAAPGSNYHNHYLHNDPNNDAVSLSSMDSYGYSLDGYAPSLGPAPHGYPVGPLIKDPNEGIGGGGDQDEEEDDVESYFDSNTLSTKGDDA